MNIILGSTSPRRKAILSGIFDSIKIIAPSIQENHLPSETPVNFSMRMSKDKCLSILESYAFDGYPSLVITADTIVTIDNAIIGKPSDFNDAVRIISLLNGKMHKVITSLTLLAIGSGTKPCGPVTSCAVTRVKFKNLSREEIVTYLETIEYMDKAGGYAFQEHGSMIIEQYHGSVTNIIGFPLRLFFAMVEELGLTDSLFN